MRPSLVALAVALTAALGALGRAEARPAPPSRDAAATSIKSWRQVGRVLAPRNTRTLARARRFLDLDLGLINAGRATPIRGLILDIDETLTAHEGAIDRAAFDRIAALIEGGVFIAAYSNLSDGRIPGRNADIARLVALGVVIAPDEAPAKPTPAGFTMTADALIAHARARGVALPRGAIAMVGDNYMTDGGAIQAGLAFIKVRPVATDERRLGYRGGRKAKRLGQRALRGYGSLAARAHDLALGRATLTLPVRE